MSRMVRACVAVLAVLALVSPLLGACLCAQTAPAADPHSCCPAPAAPRLAAAHGCCAGEARDASGATVSVSKALIEHGPALAAVTLDVPLGAPPAPSHTDYLPTRPLVLRI